MGSCLEAAPLFCLGDTLARGTVSQAPGWHHLTRLVIFNEYEIGNGPWTECPNTIKLSKRANMYLPKVYERFKTQFPDVFNNYKQLGIATRQVGPLDEKIQDLIKLGIAMGANSRGGVMSSTRKAISAGASEDEVRHAVLLTLTTTGFPNMISAMRWVDEVLNSPES
jgi:4-carboxymuconolactone decarboxylase